MLRSVTRAPGAALSRLQLVSAANDKLQRATTAAARLKR